MSPIPKSILDACKEIRECCIEPSHVDRLLETLREPAYANEWFRHEDVRRFLNEQVPRSMYVPAAVKEMVRISEEQVKMAERSTLGRQHFLDCAKDRRIFEDIKSFVVDPNDLMSSAEQSPDVMGEFARRNVHNSRYYYTKFSEWFITAKHAAQFSEPIIVDIGSAYNGFGKFVKATTAAKEINLVDILNRPGKRSLEQGIVEIGSDAAKIEEIPSGYADIVCLHNALEHFANDSDDGCLREIERMLAPNGVALITPLFFEGLYSISINPISCFFYGDADDTFVSYLVRERVQRNAILRYSFGMVSRYAHIYDCQVLTEKLAANCPNLRPTLFKVRLSDIAIQKKGVFGVDFQSDIFEKPTFYFLQLTRR